MAERSVLEFNGTEFENTIARFLSRNYPDAIILQNRGLFSPYLQKNTQVDLIMVHCKGIFVIEAKGWRGWIKGSYNDEFWNGKSSTTNIIHAHSPISQNFVHIRAIRNAIRKELGKEPVFYHNIVCLPDGAVLNTDCKEVVNVSGLSLLIDQLLITSELSLDITECAQDIISVTGIG